LLAELLEVSFDLFARRELVGQQLDVQIDAAAR
jgi:hypothetical protein